MRAEAVRRQSCDGTRVSGWRRGCDAEVCYGKRVTTMEEDERAAVHVKAWVMRRGGGPGRGVRDQPVCSRCRHPREGRHWVRLGGAGACNVPCWPPAAARHTKTTSSDADNARACAAYGRWYSPSGVVPTVEVIDSKSRGGPHWQHRVARISVWFVNPSSGRTVYTV